MLTFLVSRSLLVAGLGAAFLPTLAQAQWSHNSATNTVVRTGALNSDENQPKIVPTADGGCWISWLDGIGTGWDTRVQKLNARGVPQLPAGGVLVADSAFSSTQDYGLAVDSLGNAVVAYRDDANNGSPVQIKVQKISPIGALLWGTGVQVSVAAGGNNPRCCVTSDDGAVVLWTDSAGAAAMQKVDSNGAPMWIAGGVTDTPPAGTYFVCDVVSDNAGGALALYHHQTGNFTSPRYLKMQRFGAASGAKLWNAGSPVVVFDASSIQFAYYPSLMPDGAGGAVIAWYENGGSRNAYAQRVTQAGAEVFPHNGVAAADTIAGQIRVAGTGAFDAATGDIYLFALETNGSTQSIYRILAQRLNAAGARQWGNAGVEISPASSNQPAFLQAVNVPSAQGGGAIAMYFDRQATLSTVQVVATRLTTAGAFAWSPGTLAACSATGAKARLSSAMNVLGNRAFVAWADKRNADIPNPGEQDIFAQNINLDGSLGNPGDVNDDGSVNVTDLLAIIGTWGPCPAPPTFCPADVAPPPLGDGQINVTDLLAVIGNWG